MASDDSPSILKFLGGLLLGVVLTSSYVRYAWTVPEVVQLPGKITEAALVTTAEMDLYRPDASDAVRRRALSVVMAHQSDHFVQMDQELGGQLMEEVLRRKALRTAKLLKHQMSAYDTALQHAALRRTLETKHGRTADDNELKRRMLYSALSEEEFALWYLQTRFPNRTQSELVDIVLNSYQNELRRTDTIAAQPPAPIH